MGINREQIIKALECCSDDNSCYTAGCPYKSDSLSACTSKLAKDVLALIKELTEENERLTKNNLIFAQNVETVAANYYKLGCTDTVRKMQERLKAKCEHFTDSLKYLLYSEIDLIAKEMLEGEND